MAETTDRPIAQEMSREHMYKLKALALAMRTHQRAAIEAVIDEAFAKLPGNLGDSN